MNVLTPEACDVITAGRLAHLVTINADGSPQVSIVWVGLDRDEIVSGHLRFRVRLPPARRAFCVAADERSGCSRSERVFWRVPRIRRVREIGIPEGAWPCQRIPEDFWL
jgi:hypothetical protein